MKKLSVVSTAAFIAVLSGNCIALAAGGGAPRLQGTFRVKAKITASKGIPGEHKGQTGTEKFVLTPRCKTGSCATVLRRNGLDGKANTPMTLKPTGGLYRGSLSGGESCVKGNEVDAVVKEVVTLRPTHVAGGKVTAFTGSIVIRFTLTKLGKARHCPQSGQTVAFHT